MATYIKTLKDGSDIIVPRTQGQAVTLTSGNTLEGEFTNIYSQGYLKGIDAFENENISPSEYMVNSVYDSQNKHTDVFNYIDNNIGDKNNLQVNNKTNLVDAINELFTFASEGKASIAAALTGRGIAAAANESWESLSQKINQICGGTLITNADNVTLTGDVATNASYVNQTYGVKVGYMNNGDIIVSMQGGTSGNWEYLDFSLASAPAGVTITTSNMATTNITGKVSVIYACVLSGLTVPCEMSIAVAAGASANDNVPCKITLTQVN